MEMKRPLHLICGKNFINSEFLLIFKIFLKFLKRSCAVIIYELIHLKRPYENVYKFVADLKMETDTENPLSIPFCKILKR